MDFTVSPYLYNKHLKRSVSELLRLSVIAFMVLCAALQPLYAKSGDEKKEKGQAAPDAVRKLPIEMKTGLTGHEVYPGDEIKLLISFSSAKPFAADVLGSLPLGDFEFKAREVWRGEEEGAYVVRHSITIRHFEPGAHEAPRIPFVLKQGGEQEERKSGLMRVTVKSLLQEEAQKIALQQMKDKAAGDESGKKKSGANKPKLLGPNDGKPFGPTMNPPPVKGGRAPAPQAGQGMPPGAPPPRGALAAEEEEAQGVRLSPRDIKNPVPMFYEDYTMLYIAGALLLVLLCGLLAWWWLKRPRNVEEEAAPEFIDTRPAHLIAFERLNELEARQLVAKRRLKEYHLGLSEILRDYFARRYKLDEALSLTSEEVAASLKKLYLRDLSERLVEALLFGCDLVKFAKDEPPDDTCFERLKEARLIVERTKEETLGIQ